MVGTIVIAFFPVFNFNYSFWFQRMRQSGAFITTSESVLFMLMGDSKFPNFRDVQALVKTAAPDSGLLSKVWKTLLEFQTQLAFEREYKHDKGQRGFWNNISFMIVI